MFNSSKEIVIVLLFIFLTSCGTDNKVPDFELQTFNGKIITSTELKGKIVVLDFGILIAGHYKNDAPYGKALHQI